MTIEEAEEKLSNMHFDNIVKSYCNKVNDIKKLKGELEKIKTKETSNIDLNNTLSSFLLKFINTKTQKDEFIAFRVEGDDLVANKVTWIDWNSDDWFEIGRLKNFNILIPSDEEIKKAGWKYYQENGLYYHSDKAFIEGVKWYRDNFK